MPLGRLLVLQLAIGRFSAGLSIFLILTAMISRARIHAAVRAFIIHFFLSLVVAVLMAFLVLGVWFPHPLRYLAGGLDLFWILVGVDVVCGPVLTGLLYTPAKPRRELIMDLSLIVIIQLGALIYGIYSIAQARPVVLVFESDRFVSVAAAQVDVAALPQALPQWQSLSWSGPILLGTRKARDGIETLKSIELSLRGLEPSARPNWWQSYNDSRPLARQRMKPLPDLRAQQVPEVQAAIDGAVKKAGVPIDQIHYLPLVSQKSLDQWIALLDGEANIIGYAPVGGF